jgi:hypothetical protein
MFSYPRYDGPSISAVMREPKGVTAQDSIPAVDVEARPRREQAPSFIYFGITEAPATLRPRWAGSFGGVSLPRTHGHGRGRCRVCAATLSPISYTPGHRINEISRSASFPRGHCASWGHFRTGNGDGPIFLSDTRMTGRDCRAMHWRSPARRGTWPTGITD